MMNKLVVLLALTLAAPAHAQDWPAKPIKVVVPSPPGGPPDLIARMLAPKLQPILGQPVIVENRAGAGGIVGTAYLAKLPPDGYNWLLTTASHTNTPPFNENVPFDPVRDFTHVTLVAQNLGQALIVPPAAPFKTVHELVAYARQNPGKLNYAFAGIGTASHIPAELMKAMAGIDIVGVQYRGIPEIMGDIMTGRIDMFFVGTQVAASQAKAGKVRVLALTGAKRWKGLPDTPTMEEAGFKGYHTINWFGLWLPAAASPGLVSQIHAAVVKALADPEIRAQFDAQGLEGVGMPPAEFARFVTNESTAINELAKRIKAAKK
jgi:tripartite-type tricarboxylate transporter receptor subunit TctC